MKRLACMMALLALLGHGPLAADSPHLARDRTDALAKRLKDYMAQHHVPGLSAAIVIDGELSWSAAYGMSDLENQVPASAATVYRTASIGKTMTATAAMQLVEKGSLSLEGEIQRYCPAFPRKDHPITTRHLLSHLSGIRHYGGPRDVEEQSSTRHYGSLVEALAPFKDDPLLFAPGTRYLYSTYGYNVLGCVVEGASGIPFLEYLKKSVWQPAGMTVTRDDDPAALIPMRSRGYTVAGGEVRNAKMIDMSNRMGAGGFVTTAEDLARFAAAVLNGKLIKPETFQQMIVPTVLPDGTRVPMGLGWAVELEEWKSDTWVSHGGSTPGFSGILALMPKHRFAVAILTNLEDLPERSDLAADMATIALAL